MDIFRDKGGHETHDGLPNDIWANIHATTELNYPGISCGVVLQDGTIRPFTNAQDEWHAIDPVAHPESERNRFQFTPQDLDFLAARFAEGDQISHIYYASYTNRLRTEKVLRGDELPVPKWLNQGLHDTGFDPRPQWFPDLVHIEASPILRTSKVASFRGGKYRVVEDGHVEHRQDSIGTIDGDVYLARLNSPEIQEQIRRSRLLWKELYGVDPIETNQSQAE